LPLQLAVIDESQGDTGRGQVNASVTPVRSQAPPLALMPGVPSLPRQPFRPRFRAQANPRTPISGEVANARLMPLMTSVDGSGTLAVGTSAIATESLSRRSPPSLIPYHNPTGHGQANETKDERRRLGDGSSRRRKRASRLFGIIRRIHDLGARAEVDLVGED
jgi:hypothetical protein